jgi:tetratricopeptide (TPR) repeat protein
MKQKLMILCLLLIALAGIHLFAVENPGLIQNPTFMAPERIDPYALNHNMGEISPPYDYHARGDSLYQREHYEDAARNYLAQLQYDPYNENILYNLSRCYGMLNRPNLAAKYVALAYRHGFTNIRHIMKDKDFKKVRYVQPFKATIDSLLIVNADRPHKRY